MTEGTRHRGRKQFDVFMSYAQAGRSDLAVEVLSRLKTFGRRWYQPRGLRVFHDSTDLAASEGLWTELASHIDDSKNLLLVATPEAAASEWVPREVLRFHQQQEDRSPEDRGRLLVALLDGEIVWDDDAGGFDWEQTTAVPRSIGDLFDEEPLHVDFRPVVGLGGRERRSALDAGAARLAAGILDSEPGKLIGQRRVSRRATVAAVSTIMTLVVALAGFLVVRSVLLNREIERRDEATNVIPVRAGEIERFADSPILKVSVEVVTETLPLDGSVVEVRLTHDELFSRPMHFFVARLDEQGTWPDHLGFDEPEPRRRCQESPVATWFQWYDRSEDMVATIPLTGDPWAYGSVNFEGGEFDPDPGDPFVLPQLNGIPSLTELIDGDATIEFFLHRWDGTIEAAADPDVQLELRAEFDTEGAAVKSFAIYRSRHTPEQEQVLLIDYLVDRHPIETEALLGLYEPANPPRRAEVLESSLARYEAGEPPVDLAEAALFAGLEVNQATTDLFTSFGEGNLAGARHLEQALAFGEDFAVENAGEEAADILCWEAHATRLMTEVLLPGSEVRPIVVAKAIDRHEAAVAGCSTCFESRRDIVNLYLTLMTVLQESADVGAEHPESLAAVAPTDLIGPATRTAELLAADLGTVRGQEELDVHLVAIAAASE